MDALAKETVQTQDEALTDLYRKIRPADTPTPEAPFHRTDGIRTAKKRRNYNRTCYNPMFCR